MQDGVVVLEAGIVVQNVSEFPSPALAAQYWNGIKDFGEKKNALRTDLEPAKRYGSL